MICSTSFQVEYDVDEEDTAWLSLMNQKRETAGLAPVSVDSLELLMDRLEKESYFQVSTLLSNFQILIIYHKIKANVIT